MVGCVDDGGCSEVSVSVDGLVASTTEAVARNNGCTVNTVKQLSIQ